MNNLTSPCIAPNSLALPHITLYCPKLSCIALAELSIIPPSSPHGAEPLGLIQALWQSPALPTTCTGPWGAEPQAGTHRGGAGPHPHTLFFAPCCRSTPWCWSTPRQWGRGAAPHLVPTHPHNPGGAQIPSPDPAVVRGCPMSVSRCGRGAFVLPRLSLCAPGSRHRQPGEDQALSLSLSLSLSCRMGAEHGQDRPCSRQGPTQPTHSSPPPLLRAVPGERASLGPAPRSALGRGCHWLRRGALTASLLRTISCC